MSKWQQHIRTWIGRYFDLPSDVMLDLPRITTIGSIHLYIENHTGLLHFSDHEIRIQYKKGQVRILGKDLGVKMMLKEELLLEGELQSVEFLPDSAGGGENLRNQRDFFHGRMTVEVQGSLMEPFLQACVKRGCHISDMKRTEEGKVLLTIRLKDWQILRQLRKKYRCKISIKGGNGLPFFINQMLGRLYLVFAFLAAVVVIFLLANTLWSIKVDGLTPELEADVETHLKDYGIKPGKLTIGMSDPIEIQQKLLDDVPDLLWIGVKKQGTSYHLYGVEKTRYDTKMDNRPSNLVAAKKGMIVETFIKKGRPLVSVYDVVKKGQVLATGKLVEDKETVIHSDGEVIAETWYKVEQNLPMKQVLTLTDGQVESEYHFRLGEWEVPFWGWWKGEDGNFREENHRDGWDLFGWESPFGMKTTDHYSIDPKAYASSRDELEKLGLASGRRSLQQEIPKDAEIKEEKVLHLGEEHGKVRLILLYKVHENIAVTKYLSQGD